MRVEPSPPAHAAPLAVHVAAALTIFLLVVTGCGPAAEDPEGPGAAASGSPDTAGDGEPAGALTPAPAGGQAGEAARPEDSLTAEDGRVTAVITDILLTPQARIHAEKFKCVCSCGMMLGECSCQEEPGGITMKRYLQGLVDQELSPPDVKAAMVEKYGEAVLP